MSAEELPETLATCLQDGGFPPSASGIAEDGSRKYEPFIETQDEDFVRADEICRAQYPLEYDYAQDATADDWRRVYDHQKLVWVPCMKNTFGTDLGCMPSEEAFPADPTWVDAERFNLEFQQAVTHESLDHMNAWVTQCPDWPSLDDSEATE